MPITVTCGKCNAKLGAPDNARGKRVKCPKCASVIAVPADDFEVIEDDFEVVDDDAPKAKGKASDFEVVEDEPAVKPKARPKLARDDDDDEPVRPKKKRRPMDDDDDERPRKKGRKAAPSSNLPMILGGAFIVLALIGGGVYFATSGGSKKNDPAKIEWTSFTSPDGSFTAQFPGGAPVAGNAMDLMKDERPPKPEEKAQLDQMKAMGMSFDGWQREEGGRKYIIVQFKLPPALAAMMKPEDMAKGMKGEAKKDIQPGEKLFAEKAVTVGGQQTTQFFVGLEKADKPNQTAVFLIAKGGIIVIAVKDKSGFAETDEMMLAFFNRVTVTGK
jgi:hypothetical protein